MSVFTEAESNFDYTERRGDTTDFGRARWDYALTTGNLTADADAARLRVQGRGFGFWSYKGDPFGSDDYYDGNRCFYVRHHDYCVKNNIFSGFNWPYVRRY